MYRCQPGLAPPYLADDLQGVADIESRQRLRSASTLALVVVDTQQLAIVPVVFVPIVI